MTAKSFTLESNDRAASIAAHVNNSTYNGEELQVGQPRVHGTRRGDLYESHDDINVSQLSRYGNSETKSV